MDKTLKQAAVEAPQEALKIIQEMKSGNRNFGVEWGEDIVAGKVTIKEMIGTDDGSRDFIEKITFDLYQGREAHPLLYKDIYSTLTDANFPKLIEVEEFGPVQVVFLEKWEGGEIKFGAMGPGSLKSVSFHTYAAGIEYDEDMVEFNQTWRITEIGTAFGEAYNKLLNHLHLSAIISGSFITTGGGLAAQKLAQSGVEGVADSGIAQLIAWNTDLSTTLTDAVRVLPAGSIILCNSFDRVALDTAIAGSIYPDFRPTVMKSKLSGVTFIEYDGETVTVGGKTYTYTGVAAGFAYLLAPKKNFREYIKHDLRVDSNNGDLSRLIVSQVVGRTRRAVFAALGGKMGAVKIDITA